jgi:hypothetical protein
LFHQNTLPCVGAELTFGLVVRRANPSPDGSESRPTTNDKPFFG